MAQSAAPHAALDRMCVDGLEVVSRADVRQLLWRRDLRRCACAVPQAANCLHHGQSEE